MITIPNKRNGKSKKQEGKMSDSFTEVTNESWFGRIGGAIKGVLVGLVLIVIALGLLFWNEGRSVKRYKTLKEGSGAVVSVKSDKVDSANEGKLIHMTGKADTDATLSDSVFGVSANALKLERVVEMYQWKETSKSESKKKVGGGKKTVTTYTYSKAWSKRAISSGSFKKPDGHQNPGSMPYESLEQVADNVTFGAFKLPLSLVSKINNFESLPVGPDMPLPEPLKDTVKPNDGGFYIGESPASPQVGDVRVKFKVVKPGEVSIVSKQVGNTFEPYQTKAGGAIALLEIGVFSADTMFKSAQKSNRVLTWILRLVGFVLMFIGFNMIFKPLSVIADVVPFIGSIVGVGTGIIAFLISLALSLLTIAIAWIYYRPVLGVSLLVIVVVLIVLTGGKLKSAKPATQSAG